MSFVFTHEQVMREGHTFGVNVLASQRVVIVGENAQTFSHEPVGTYTGGAAAYPYPQLPDDAIVDTRGASVTATNVLLRYAQAEASPVAATQPNHLGVKTEVAGARGFRVGDIVKLPGRSAEIMAVMPGDDGFSTLVLSRNIPVDCREAAVFDVDFCLLINNVSLPQASCTKERFTIPRDLRLLTSAWAPDNKPIALPVIEADIAITYKIWYSTDAAAVKTIHCDEDLQAIRGDVVSENDLKMATSLAFLNAGGRPVSYIAVPEPLATQSWIAALNRIDDGYSIVPCTTDPEVLTAVTDFVDQRSKPEVGRECVAWFSLATPNRRVIADASNSVDFEPLAGELVSTGGGAVVEVPAGNARFMSLGVEKGDILHVHGADEYVIEEVVNDDSIRLQGDQFDHTGPVAIHIWRRLDADGVATAIADKAASYRNKRIRAVWPNTLTVNYDDDRYAGGWCLCAALAGLRSGCVPHRDLTGVQLLGISHIPASPRLDSDQLDMMAECGVWVVEQQGDNIITRRAITTAGLTDPGSRAEAIVTNLDSINRGLRDSLRKAMQTVAITGRFQARVAGKLRKTMEGLIGRKATSIGAQLIAGDIEVMRRHVFLEGSLVLNVKLTIPTGFGSDRSTPTIDVHQTVIA